MFRFRGIWPLIPVLILLTLSCERAKEILGPKTDSPPALDTTGAALYHTWRHDSSAQFPTSDTAFVGGQFTVHIRSQLTLGQEYSDYLRIVDTLSMHRIFHPILSTEVVIAKFTTDTLEEARGRMTLSGDILRFHNVDPSPPALGGNWIDTVIHAWKIQFGDGYLGLRLEWLDGRGEWYQQIPNTLNFADTSCTSVFSFCARFAAPVFRGNLASTRLPRDSTELLGYWLYQGQIKEPAPRSDTLNREYLVRVRKQLSLNGSESYWTTQSDTALVGEIGKDPTTGLPVHGNKTIRGNVTGISGRMSWHGDSLSIINTIKGDETGLVRSWKIALTEHGFGLIATGEDSGTGFYIRNPL